MSPPPTERVRQTFERPGGGVRWLHDLTGLSASDEDDWIARELAAGTMAWRGVEVGPGIPRGMNTQAVVIERAKARRLNRFGQRLDGRAVLVVVQRWSWTAALAESTDVAITAGRSILASGYAYNY